MNLELNLVRGLPGSGKSTIGRKFGHTLLEADMYHTTVYGEYLFDHGRVPLASKWLIDTTMRLLVSKQSVTVTGVFCTNKSIWSFKELAEEVGATFTVVEMAQGFTSVHNVPDEVIQIMRDNVEPLDLINRPTHLYTGEQQIDG